MQTKRRQAKRRTPITNIPKAPRVSKIDMLRLATADTPSMSAQSSVDPGKLPAVILYGSACSGLGTEEWAAKAAHPNRRHEFLFTVDPSEDSKIWLKANSGAHTHIDSVEDADFLHAEPVTTFVAGFPCPPFSCAGLGEGVEGAQGAVVWFLVRYIESRQPRIAILDNVEGLATHHPKVFTVIVKMLQDIRDNVTMEPCYSVHWQVLDSLVVGAVPHRRKRLFIVCVKRCGRVRVPFRWPEPITPLTLEDIFDAPVQYLHSYRDYSIPSGRGGSQVVKRNITRALDNISLLAA